jgi:hypothetical protein
MIIGVALICLSFLILASTWWFFMAIPGPSPVDPILIVAFVIFAVIIVAAVISLRKQSIWLLGLATFYAFATLLLLFSTLYLQDGTTRNFNYKLSHLDAIYFALGTLSTAGTGNIVAISETARTIQSLQMGVDFGLTALVIGVFVSRLGS